jgi:hypothetical protein
MRIIIQAVLPLIMRRPWWGRGGVASERATPQCPSELGVDQTSSARGKCMKSLECDQCEKKDEREKRLRRAATPAKLGRNLFEKYTNGDIRANKLDDTFLADEKNGGKFENRTSDAI